MLRYAVDHGVNYVDTAYVYHEGTASRGSGEALAGRLSRAGCKVATKLPVWQVKSAADFDRILDEQLPRGCGRESFDFYLLHGLDETIWAKVAGRGRARVGERALGRRAHRPPRVQLPRRRGRCSRRSSTATTSLGRSARSSTTTWTKTPSRAAAACGWRRSKGLGVIVMEPLRGGQLTAPPPQVLARSGPSRDVRRTPAEWALQWVWDQPEVSAGAERHEHDGADRSRTSAGRRTLGVAPAERRRARRWSPRARRLPRADAHRLHAVPVLPALPERRRHTALLRDLQRRSHLRRAGPARLYYGWIDEGARADRCTRLRRAARSAARRSCRSATGWRRSTLLRLNGAAPTRPGPRADGTARGPAA